MNQNLETKPESQDESSATNQAGTAERIQPPAQYKPDREGLPPSSLDEALGALVSDIRRFVPLALIRVFWSWARDNNARLAALAKENDILRGENRELNKDNVKYREENASLNASDKEQRRHRPLVIFASGLGPVLFFMGLELSRSDATATLGWTLMIAGAVSLAIGIWIGDVIPKVKK